MIAVSVGGAQDHQSGGRNAPISVRASGGSAPSRLTGTICRWEGPALRIAGNAGNRYWLMFDGERLKVGFTPLASALLKSSPRCLLRANPAAIGGADSGYSWPAWCWPGM